MKNFINYYYNFNIYNIHFNDGKYFFYHKHEKYMLKCIEDPNMILIYLELCYQLSNFPYFFNIIVNRNDDYITLIENKPYVLLKLSKIENDKISIFDIRTDIFINLNNKISSLNHFPWVRLWENKIDYFEEWFCKRQNSYKNIYPLFHYFVGIAENALLYFKQSEIEENKDKIDQLVISHYRLNINNNLYDYYDPTNAILDHASRDVSEYLKSCFVNKIWDFDLIKEYLKQHVFSKYGIRIMLSRIMFPSFFFDYIEEMITNNSEIDLLYLETRADEFQRFLKQIMLFLVEEYNIPEINWIIKKT